MVRIKKNKSINLSLNNIMIDKERYNVGMVYNAELHETIFTSENLITKVKYKSIYNRKDFENGGFTKTQKAICKILENGFGKIDPRVSIDLWYATKDWLKLPVCEFEDEDGFDELEGNGSGNLRKNIDSEDGDDMIWVFTVESEYDDPLVFCLSLNEVKEDVMKRLMRMCRDEIQESDELNGKIAVLERKIAHKTSLESIYKQRIKGIVDGITFIVKKSKLSNKQYSYAKKQILAMSNEFKIFFWKKPNMLSLPQRTLDQLKIIVKGNMSDVEAYLNKHTGTAKWWTSTYGRRGYQFRLTQPLELTGIRVALKLPVGSVARIRHSRNGILIKQSDEMKGEQAGVKWYETSINTELKSGDALSCSAVVGSHHIQYMDGSNSEQKVKEGIWVTSKYSKNTDDKQLQNSYAVDMKIMYSS